MILEGFSHEIATPEVDDGKSGCHGFYFQLDDNVGVKIRNWGSFESQEQLAASGVWKSALKELENLKAAYPSGVSPKPFGVGAVFYQSKWWAGIYMEHIVGERLELSSAANYDWQGDTVFNILRAKLLNCGVVHWDLGSHNIIVQLVEGRIDKATAIDFTTIDG